MRAKVFKFCIPLESGQVYCGKENQDADINFAFFSIFAFFHLSFIPLICPFFFVSKQIFCDKFLSFYESQSSNFVYTYRVAKYI